MPEPEAQVDLQTSATPQPEPAATPAPSPSPQPQSLGQQMHAATAATPGPEAAAPAAESNWQGVRDFARAQGVDLPYDDDGAALSSLLNAHRQLQQRNYYADLGQRIAPYAGQVQEFLRQRQQQQAQQQAQPAAWVAPEFNKSWLQQVERDEATGLLRSRPGYDPQVADRVQAYMDWRERFLENPEQVVAPLIEQRAQQLIDARFAEHQQRSQADQLVAGHTGWMFASSPQGGRQLTPEGLLYAQAARHLWDSGLRDVRALDAAATAHVENAVLRRRLAAGGSPAPATPPGALPPVGGAAARPAAGLPAAPQTTLGLTSLRELLKSRLNGIPEDATL